MATKIQNGYNSDTSYIDGKEFQNMAEAFISMPFGDAYEIVYTKITKIITIKCRSYMKGSDEIEDLIQDVNIRLFTRLGLIMSDPVQFFSRKGKIPDKDELGKCFRNYILCIAMNLLHDKYNKNVESFSIDDDESGEFFENLISDEMLLVESIEELESSISIYRLCLTVLFKLKSKPYIILGFCFNVLIYGVESGRAERGCSSYTAEAIANKMLGVLLNEFCDYHLDNLRPIPKEIIIPFDERLKEEYEGKPFNTYITKTFYGDSPEKSISDWTYSTRKSLLTALVKKQEIIEYWGWTRNYE